MSVLGIRKKTKQGAWMYDTIDSSEFPRYRAKGWQYQTFHKKPKPKTIKYIKRQISYFTKRHKQAKNLKSKLDYSRRIYFWENELKKRRKRLR